MKAMRKKNADSAIHRKNTFWNAKAMAFCGVMTALCVVMLYLGSLSVLDLSSVVVCALVTMLAVVELGNKYAWLMVGAVGIVSFLLLPAKLISLTYIFIGGIYPILKGYFEKYHPFLAWLFKMSAMGTMYLILIVLSKVVFTAEDTYLELTIPAILIGLIFLVIYDMALTGCITFYIVKLRRRLGLKKLF